MNISRLILRKLRQEHIGKDNAIKRKDLLSWLHEQGAEIEDREMRATVKTMPIICACEQGYFIAQSHNEVEYSIRYFHKKAMSLLKYVGDKKRAYPQFYSEDPPREPIQEELF